MKQQGKPQEPKRSLILRRWKVKISPLDIDLGEKKRTVFFLDKK